MQFQVPQFIEVEDKIFGPLTFKQFVYIAGGLGLAYILWRVLPSFVAAPLALATAAFGAALAFVSYNGQPFILGIEHAFYFFVRSKLYLWSNTEIQKSKTAIAVAEKTASQPQVYVPHLSESRLHELAWSLDIKERIAAGTAHDEDRSMTGALGDVVAPIKTARDAMVK